MKKLLEDASLTARSCLYARARKVVNTPTCTHARTYSTPTCMFAPARSYVPVHARRRMSLHTLLLVLASLLMISRPNSVGLCRTTPAVRRGRSPSQSQSLSSPQSLSPPQSKSLSSCQSQSLSPPQSQSLSQSPTLNRPLCTMCLVKVLVEFLFRLKSLGNQRRRKVTVGGFAPGCVCGEGRRCGS